MANLLADNLPGGVRLASDGNGYEFGFTYNGVFVPVGYVKAGGLDADVAEAKQAAQQAQQQQAQTQQQ